MRALDRVALTVRRGDRIGLLGHNGSGKSTLLKVLSSIYIPTSGNMESKVHVVPLLDLNLGVDDEMTGIEAIRVGCLLRGIAKHEIGNAVADVCEFSETRLLKNNLAPFSTDNYPRCERLASPGGTAVDILSRMEPTPADAPANHLIGFPLPWITGNIVGLGGLSKVHAEDFFVEEIPAYPPEESGEFLFLWVEKQGLSAEQLISQLARCLRITHQDVGTAGMKDRQAVTRQMVSVPVRCQPLVESFAHEQIRILEIHRHRHKLRTGHLRGNRFSILVRDAAPGDVAPGNLATGNLAPGAEQLARAIGEQLARTGVPNFFGDQRFGRDAETLKLGLELLQGSKHSGDIPRTRRKFLLRLALSAVQSALFNRALVERMADGLIFQVLAGDVMQVVASGGPFVVVDPAIEQPRFDAREIVISGPIFGPKMKQPAEEVARREARLLESAGIPGEAFERYSKLTPGTRRPYLVWPEGLKITAEPGGIRLEFSLPSGCYATVVLREFQKTQ